jgi:hypothetical protein
MTISNLYWVVPPTREHLPTKYLPAPLISCSYNRAFNMEVKERTSKNGRVDVKSLNQYREEVREAQEEAELLIERERLADLEKPKTKPRNTPAKVAGLIKWQNACEKQLAEAEAAALEHANGQDAPKQEEAEDANGDGPRNN